MQDYVHAAQWDEDTAGRKLAPLLSKSWVGKTVLTRLSVRSQSKADLIGALAEESGASPEHKARVELLLEYLKMAGLIRENGDMFEKVQDSPLHAPQPPKPPTVEKHVEYKHREDVDTFSIPIPGHAPATITVPKSLTDEDWEMLSGMIELYINRLKKTRMTEKARPGSSETGP